MTGSRQKACFCRVGTFGFLTRQIQCLLTTLELADIGIGQYPAAIGHSVLPNFNSGAIRTAILGLFLLNACQRRISGVQDRIEILSGHDLMRAEPEQIQKMLIPHPQPVFPIHQADTLLDVLQCAF